MGRLVRAAFGCSVLFVVTFASPQDRKFDYAKQAQIDAQGNIYVSSGAGQLIKVADAGHCIEVRVAEDLQTVVCAVPRSRKEEEVSQSLRLEIYFKGGQKKTIELVDPILDWHSWNGGRQIAVYSGPRDRQGVHALYDTKTARMLERFDEPPEQNLLPQWAKSQAQLDDESVPESESLSEDRRKWIAKVLRRIQKVEPGMTRKDLLKVFTTEGGISTRLQRTYLLIECMYIKVDVRFKPANDRHDILEEDPDDIIESISRPYLHWSIMD